IASGRAAQRHSLRAQATAQRLGRKNCAVVLAGGRPVPAQARARTHLGDRAFANLVFLQSSADGTNFEGRVRFRRKITITKRRKSTIQIKSTMSCLRRLLSHALSRAPALNLLPNLTLHLHSFS